MILSILLLSAFSHISLYILIRLTISYPPSSLRHRKTRPQNIYLVIENIDLIIFPRFELAIIRYNSNFNMNTNQIIWRNAYNLCLLGGIGANSRTQTYVHLSMLKIFLTQHWPVFKFRVNNRSYITSYWFKPKIYCINQRVKVDYFLSWPFYPTLILNG